MSKNPFKFLDSYTKEDKDIFFGRETEIEELYQKVFESKILLVCGVSGTGKSSLIDCGLANKFEDSDWLPINIRRGTDINDSLRVGISKSALTKVKESKSLTKQLQSLYLDHFKPIYLIFDQFEELFIFGSKEERKKFIKEIKRIADSDIQCRLLFVMREEYLAGAIEFEREIPTFLINRLRIEKMTWHNAKQVIEEPCKIYNIEVEKGFSETVLEKLSPESTEVELTYLQVFLDKAFRLATDKNKEKPGFTNELFEQIGDVSDLLGSFLEEQISELEDPDTGLVILKSFVSIKGTKRQITEGILRDKDENGRYELRHDGLATKIYEKITLVEKELLEVRQFIDSAYSNYEKRNVYLSVEDLKYIALYEDSLFLNKRTEKFIEESKKEAEKAKRRRRNIAIAAAITLIVVLSGFTIWAINERGKAIEQTKFAENQRKEAIKANEIAENAKEEALHERNRAKENEQIALQARSEAEQSKNQALRARDIVTRELYKAIKSSLAISSDNLNVLYYGLENHFTITASGILPENLIVNIDQGDLKKIEDGKYIIRPTRIYKSAGDGRGRTIMRIVSVKGITTTGDTIFLGSKKFKVKSTPDPYAIFAGRKGGDIPSSVAKAQVGLFVEIGIDYDIRFDVVSFSIIIEKDSTIIERHSNSYKITDEQKELLRSLSLGDEFLFTDIIAKGPDGSERSLPDLNFRFPDSLAASIRFPDNIQFTNDGTKRVWKERVQTYLSKNDWDGLAQFINLNLRKFHYDDPELMNRIIEIIYKTADKPKILSEAEKWALKGIDYENNSENNYLLAAILFKQGKEEEGKRIKEITINMITEKLKSKDIDINQKNSLNKLLQKTEKLQFPLIKELQE